MRMGEENGIDDGSGWENVCTKSGPTFDVLTGHGNIPETGRMKNGPEMDSRA